MTEIKHDYDEDWLDPRENQSTLRAFKEALRDINRPIDSNDLKEIVEHISSLEKMDLDSSFVKRLGFSLRSGGDEKGWTKGSLREGFLRDVIEEDVSHFDADFLEDTASESECAPQGESAHATKRPTSDAASFDAISFFLDEAIHVLETKHKLDFHPTSYWVDAEKPVTELPIIWVREIPANRQSLGQFRFRFGESRWNVSYVANEKSLVLVVEADQRLTPLQVQVPTENPSLFLSGLLSAFHGRAEFATWALRSLRDTFDDMKSAV